MLPSMTEVLDLGRIEQPSYTGPELSTSPIQVDEQNQLVTVAAGVSQRLLLDYLAAHTYAEDCDRAQICSCRFALIGLHV